MIVAGISIPDAELIEDLIEKYGIGFGTSVRELVKTVRGRLCESE